MLEHRDDRRPFVRDFRPMGQSVVLLSRAGRACLLAPSNACDADEQTEAPSLGFGFTMATAARADACPRRNAGAPRLNRLLSDRGPSAGSQAVWARNR